MHGEFGALADGGGVAPPRGRRTVGSALGGHSPTSVRPEAVAVMKELGIDISRQWSKSVDEFAGREFDFVITVCDHANAVCPVFPGNTRRLHWPFEDPAAVTGTAEAKLDSFPPGARSNPGEGPRVCRGDRSLRSRLDWPVLRDRPALAERRHQVLVGVRVVGELHLRWSYSSLPSTRSAITPSSIHSTNGAATLKLEQAGSPPLQARIQSR